MSVLIGIVTKNRKDLLRQAILSCYQQEYADKSIEVIDECSVDETRDLVREFPVVHWNFRQEERGYLEGRNELMRKATQKYFCSLDDDSWFLDPDCLSIAVSAMERDASIGCIAFDILSPNRKERSKRAGKYEVANFIGCGHLLRLSAVREVGYYTPNPLSYGGEEKDMCLSLIDHGYSIQFVSGVHIWHDKSMLGRDLNRQHTESLCNDLVITYRRVPGLLVFQFLLYRLLSHGYFALKFQRGKFAPAYVKGVSGFFAVWRTLKRRPVALKTYLRYLKLVRLSRKALRSGVQSGT